MGKVFIMDHPLIQHKIGIIRNIETGTKQFRELISEIATLECFEATRDLELEDYPVTTPMGDTVCKKIAGKKTGNHPDPPRRSRHGIGHGNTSSGSKDRSYRSLS